MQIINIIQNHGLNQKAICRYANSHGYNYIVATPICSGSENFILSSDYPENFISIFINYKNSFITDRQTIMKHLLVNSILRRFMVPSVSEDELLFCAWIDYCKITEQRDNSVKSLLNIDDVSKIVNIAFTDTPENFIQKCNIDLDYYKYNARQYYLKYFIKLSERKTEVSKYAELAYCLLNNSGKVNKYADILKINKISVKMFCNILQYYNPGMKYNELIQLGFKQKTIKRFKKCYKTIFNDTQLNKALNRKERQETKVIDLQPSLPVSVPTLNAAQQPQQQMQQPVQNVPPVPAAQSQVSTDTFNAFAQAFTRPNYDIPFNRESYFTYILQIANNDKVDLNKLKETNYNTYYGLSKCKADLEYWIENNNKPEADKVLKHIIDLIKGCRY